MRRTTALKFAAAGGVLALLSIGGATAFAEEESEPTAVVNKNGHEVDEHAADGQARAAEARAQRLSKAAERETNDEETAEPAEEKTNNGNHGGPDEHAGDHPNTQAFENPQPHEPQNDGAQGPRDGYGPNERAGDHPNVNATDGPGGRGGQ